MTKRRNALFKAIVILLTVLMGGMMMFGLSGCGGKKYAVDYCGQKDFYSNAKDSYREGQKVTLYYPLIATDTDYHFYLDGETLNYLYEDNKGFAIKFVMPDHDVKLECVSTNSMTVESDPEIETLVTDEDVMLVDYYTAVVGTVGGDHYTERVLYDYSDTQAKLTVYTKYDGEEEQSVSYLVPYEAVEKCREIIKKNKLNVWNKKYDGPAPTGGVTAVRFRCDDGSYVRVSTDAMPDDGERIMDSIGAVMQSYVKDEYQLDE